MNAKRGLRTVGGLLTHHDEREPVRGGVLPATFATISSAIGRGTSSYRANCIVYVARPWVMERTSVAYPNIWASGTWARITWAPARASMATIFPRRLLRSPTTAPWYSEGQTTSTSITGSSRTG